MQPWCTGPAEILDHGLRLLLADSDRNRRLALISIDNAVELIIKTYLGLPRRVTGLQISRREFSQFSESFPALLDALEQYAAGDKLDGINLGEIEWYHRLRNQLYHQGNGLTVERSKVDVYAELARVLFLNLFGEELKTPESVATEHLGSFLSAWVELERTITRIARQYKGDLAVTGGRLLRPMHAVAGLRDNGVFSSRFADQFDRLRVMRNELVHGQAEAHTVLNSKVLADLSSLISEAESIANNAE